LRIRPFALVSLSAAQLSTFHSFSRGNNRPVQNLNGRAVVEDTSN
jgi:carbonic anhydrase